MLHMASSRLSVLGTCFPFFWSFPTASRCLRAPGTPEAANGGADLQCRSVCTTAKTSVAPHHDADFVIMVETPLLPCWCIEAASRDDATDSSRKAPSSGNIKLPWNEYVKLCDAAVASSEDRAVLSKQDFRRRVLRAHPDKGGRAEDFHALMSSYRAEKS